MRDEVTVEKRDLIKSSERENRELPHPNEFLR